MSKRKKNKVVIVGAGPSGLFCAYHLLKAGFHVDMYDHSSGPAKKFLIAGNGGLNITHSEPIESFSEKYGKNKERFKNYLNNFSPKDLQAWCQEIGVETFIGSSGRVFPKEMSAGKFLLKWLSILKNYDHFQMHLNHKLTSLKIMPDKQIKQLTFQTKDHVFSSETETLIMALGGGSWKSTGSDGQWIDMMKNIGIKTHPLLPMNSGFETNWSEFFKTHVKRHHLKKVCIKFKHFQSMGDLMLTEYGLEGGPLYALSHHIRDEILEKGSAILYVDLKPHYTHEKIKEILESKKNKTSFSNHLRKKMAIDKKTFIFLKELLIDKGDKNEEQLLSFSKIKNIPIQLNSLRPIDEAISTSGGICFSDLTDSMESKKIPGLYFAGEMLDYEAPTGGYLLQGCFSSSFVIANTLKNKN